MPKDSELVKEHRDKGLKGLAVTNLSPGFYVIQKKEEQSDRMTSATGRKGTFSKADTIGSATKEASVIYLATTSIVYPKEKAKEKRISVPIDYLDSPVGTYFAVDVNAGLFVNFRDEALSPEQAKQILEGVLE